MVSYRSPNTFLIAAFSLLITGCDSSSSGALFQKVSPDNSGIEFSNDLVYNNLLTVLEFEYMYNGAGVAAGDLNNDGLQDLYFTGNMVSSRLYLNRGDWKFEDVTVQAGVVTTGWSNGVSMIDINQDGWKDLYVCRGGPRGTTEKERANLLFLNNGDGTFTEAAAGYGLDDSGYSVQAAFFDYDRDGDLDVYLLSNALVDFNRNTSRPKEISGKAPSVDKLFRNNGDNTFTDVSAPAGILIEGFGLGVEICDINNDQWPDIYVSNDFLTDDLLYVNQRNGAFVNEAGRYLKHQTYNGMGNDLADFNNDGLVDIVVLDMLPADIGRWKLTSMGNNYDEFQTSLSYGYQPQYIRNTLQLNNGNGTFSEIGQLAGIDATDWSWSALFADYDNDGLKDLLVTNGYRQDITNLDFMVYGNQVLTMGTPEANRKQRLEALNKLPGIKIHNYVYKNQGDLTFSDESENWGLSAPSYSNGAVYADLDNDGDLDLAINNIDEKATVYRNFSRESNKKEKAGHYLRIGLSGPPLNREGVGAKVFLRYNGAVQHQYFSPVRGYISTVEPFLHFGLGETEKIDSLEIIWPDGNYQLLLEVAADQVLELDYADSAPPPLKEHDPGTREPVFTEAAERLRIDYRHRENEFVDFKVQPLLPHMHSRNGPGIAVGDVNNDGLEDFYVGGATGYAGGMFIQLPDGGFERKTTALDSVSEDMGVLFFDADNDDDLDLYLVSGGSAHTKGSALYRDRFYLNDGQGGFYEAEKAIPDIRQSGSCVVAGDYDRDGDLDLFIGGRVTPGEYPMTPRSYVLRNEGANFIDVTDEIAPEIAGIGMVTSALWTDFDNDGRLDLILAGEFMPIQFFHNREDRLVQVTESTGLNSIHGWWNSLTGGDFDNDGDTDYLAGNLGLNTRYHASAEEPLCIYAHDFDKNGRIDPVMCYYFDGENYIAHSRDDIIKQINPMRARFRTYDDYAKATFDKSFLPEELAPAYVVRSERFENSYIENLGGGKFAIKALPVAAQVAPVYGMIADDFDGDGNLDALLSGNFYSGEVSIGRYDASIGLLLRGDGNGNFTPAPVEESGFFVDNDAKGMAQLTMGDGEGLILAAGNSARLKAFTNARKKSDVYRLLPDDAFAVVTRTDGRTFKKEFYYGSGYLSQSSRSISLTEDIRSVVIYNFSGKKRELKEEL